MTETLALRYSSESTQRELSSEYQHDRVKMVFKKSLHPCALDESSLCIGRVNTPGYKWKILGIKPALPFSLMCYVDVGDDFPIF